MRIVQMRYLTEVCVRVPSTGFLFKYVLNLSTVCSVTYIGFMINEKQYAKCKSDIYSFGIHEGNAQHFLANSFHNKQLIRWRN